MAVMIMEALDGFAHKYSWSLVPPLPPAMQTRLNRESVH